MERGFVTNEAEWTRKVEIRKEEISGSVPSMHGYILAWNFL